MISITTLFANASDTSGYSTQQSYSDSGLDTDWSDSDKLKRKRPQHVSEEIPSSSNNVKNIKSGHVWYQVSNPYMKKIEGTKNKYRCNCGHVGDYDTAHCHRHNSHYLDKKMPCINCKELGKEVILSTPQQWMDHSRMAHSLFERTNCNWCGGSVSNDPTSQESHIGQYTNLTVLRSFSDFENHDEIIQKSEKRRRASRLPHFRKKIKALSAVTPRAEPKINPLHQLFFVSLDESDDTLNNA